MKTNKKLKYSLISSLTLIASAISVVACGIRSKNDISYINFISSLNNNLKDPAKQKDFLKKNSSFKVLNNYIMPSPSLGDEPVASIVNNSINPEKTYIFDSKNQIKLSDLKYGGINIDKDKGISFTNNNVTINLDDKAFFVSNFDISFKYDKAFTKTKEVTYNFSSFFQLDNATDVTKLSFKEFDSGSESTPLVDFDPVYDTNFSFDPKEQQKSLSLDLENNDKVVGVNFKPTTTDNFNWSKASDFSVFEKYYCNVDFDNADSLKFKDNTISFTYNSVLIHGYLEGFDSHKTKSYASDFYLVEDLTKLNKKNKFSFNTNSLDFLAIVFSENNGYILNK